MTSPGVHDAHAPKVIDRIDHILEALLVEGPLTLTELSKAAGIPRSSCHRILVTMLRMRWVCRVGDEYEVGTRMFYFGTAAVRTHWFHQLALPYLDELQKRSGLVVHFGYLEDNAFIIWEKLWGKFGANIPTRVGSRLGAHATAAGKALLASTGMGHIDTSQNLHRYTDQTVIYKTRLRRELTSIRNRGFAVDDGELISGVGCVATTVEAQPKKTESGVVMTAAVSLCGPLDEVRKNKGYETLLLEKVVEMSRHAQSHARKRMMSTPVDIIE